MPILEKIFDDLSIEARAVFEESGLNPRQLLTALAETRADYARAIAELQHRADLISNLGEQRDELLSVLTTMLSAPLKSIERTYADAHSLVSKMKSASGSRTAHFACSTDRAR